MDGTSRLLVNEVLKNLFWRGESLLGPAVFAAKCSLITWYPTNDNLYGPAVLWTLFGDPALRVRHGIPTALAEQPRASVPGLDLRVLGSRVSYSLPGSGRVGLRVYSQCGALVGRLPEAWQSAGEHRLALGIGLPAGIHFVVLEFLPDGSTQPARLVRKLALAR